MNMMTPLISRDALRFDPIYGDTRHRVPPRSRVRASRVIHRSEDARPGSSLYTQQFMSAFAGGLVFFSILIF